MRCAQARPPAGAVLDLDLGEGPTGIDLAHGLRRLIPTLPIVMLTSYSDPLHAGLTRELPTGVPYVVKSATSTADAISSAIALARAGVAPDREVAGAVALSAGQW